MMMALISAGICPKLQCDIELLGLLRMHVADNL